MSASPLVLSLFPGIGLLDRAFEEEGFTIVRGPDVLWGGDIRRFHPPEGVFEGVIGGPPCQPFSRLRFMVEQNGYQTRHQNLIPEFERCVREAQPFWFLMEEVPLAPLPEVAGYTVHSQVFNNRWLGEEQHRVRRISFGTADGRRLLVEVAPLESPIWEYGVMASGGGRPVPVALQRDGAGGHRKKSALKSWGYQSARNFKKALQLQGLPEDFLDEAPFTLDGKYQVIGNGVPLPMGRAIARAVKRAVEQTPAVSR